MKKFRFSSALMAAVLSTTLAAALSFSNQSFSNQSFANQSVSNHSPSNPNSSSPSALINEDVPDSYTVVPGDTLWDISALFLKDPWMWPEIWHANQQIDNPHLIYPGDVISLVYINGVPQLKIVRSREVKLSPEIRSLDHGDAISALPL
ncbi:LysM peptidoglycan-binding domain-containing protein, partial [Porticoccaceae bacterium]|nr:LysM peptidoglycan-binding domain-containing protein [Porticoccaceae bacterium]